MSQILDHTKYGQKVIAITISVAFINRSMERKEAGLTLTTENPATIGKKGILPIQSMAKKLGPINFLIGPNLLNLLGRHDWI